MTHKDDLFALTDECLSDSTDVLGVILHSRWLETQPLLRRGQVDSESGETFCAEPGYDVCVDAAGCEGAWDEDDGRLSHCWGLLKWKMNRVRCGRGRLKMGKLNWVS